MKNQSLLRCASGNACTHAPCPVDGCRRVGARPGSATHRPAAPTGAAWEEERVRLIGLFAARLAFTAAAMLTLGLVGVYLRDASIADIWWGPGFAAIAAFTYWLGGGGDPARSLLLVVLAAAWGLRLGVYLFWRNAGKGEDYRYQLMRRKHGERFARVSLTSVFGLQGAL